MAEALDSPRRKADFERMNREDALDHARRDMALTPAECLEKALAMTRFAFELSEAAEASRASRA